MPPSSDSKGESSPASGPPPEAGAGIIVLPVVLLAAVLAGYFDVDLSKVLTWRPWHTSPRPTFSPIVHRSPRPGPWWGHVTLSPSPTSHPTALPSFRPSPAAPTPAPSPVATTNELLDAEMQLAWDRLTIGNIAYNPQAEMTQGVVSEVMARVTRGSDTAELTQGFPTPPRIEALKVSPTMQAYLTEGTKGTFEINPIGDTAEQALVGPYAEWKWTVRPLESGTQTLHLTVVAIIHLSDGKTRRKGLSKKADIRVVVNPAYVARTTFEKYWQWLLGGLSPVVIVVWIWTRLQRKKRERIGYDTTKALRAREPAGLAPRDDDKGPPAGVGS